MTDKRFISARQRAAFTLIELLMVIIVVGILAGILLLAISGARRAGGNAQSITEIDQLQTSIETFKTDRGAYPSSMGVFVGELPAQMQARVMRLVAKAFPRYTGDYAMLKNDVALATQYNVANWPATISTLDTDNVYQSAHAGAGSEGLNIDKLDPAETLVFWLGGLPDPSSETKLSGFRMDPSSPFVEASARASGKDSATGSNLDQVPPSSQGQRSQLVFPFDPKRLVDYDGDGWFEYLPPGGTTEKSTPPLVYFDNTTYKFAPAYPYPRTATGNTGAAYDGLGFNEATWGNCIPYLADSATVTPLKFVNSTKFQILAAGIDNKYGNQFQTADYVSSGNPYYLPRKYLPSGTNFGEGDADNLSNFARGPLGEEAPQQ